MDHTEIEIRKPKWQPLKPKWKTGVKDYEHPVQIEKQEQNQQHEFQEELSDW